MDNIIRLLPDNIANQIAAGEVIQRPASVVKELIENAIDAGATKIDVNIKDAGKTLIQVVDNGIGMNSQDAVLCFERHATSKVSKAEDLFQLTTKGFRGEALASIAAIAHVTLKTRKADCDTGIEITIEGSKISSKEDTVCPVGTAFEVKNLFFNVPARRNFLKSDKVEFGHISDEFERVSFAHPSIQFSLKHNGVEVYNLPEAVLRRRVVDIIGKNQNDRLVPIDESTDIVTLKGFVLKPEFAKKTRGEQFLFVNDRFFKSQYFNHAVNKAFEGLISDKSFPSYFLYLTVNPEKIDVNVHPTKTEIKFEEEKFIYSILLSSVRQALGKYNIAPTLDFERETSFDIPSEMSKHPTREPQIKVNPDYNPFTSNTTRSATNSTGSVKQNYSKAIKSQGFGQNEATQDDWANFYEIQNVESEEAQAEIVLEETHKIKGGFLVKNSMILTPSKSGLLLIHARRALEQIVYSELHNSFITKPINSQALLFPLEKEVSKTEIIGWTENNSLLNQLGFNGSIKDNVLEITSVPNVLEEENLQDTISDILEMICHREIEKGDLAHGLIATLAANASMRKLDLSNNDAVQSLIDRLFLCENHMYTPRNKKIIESITTEELEKKLN